MSYHKNTHPLDFNKPNTVHITSPVQSSWGEQGMFLWETFIDYTNSDVSLSNALLSFDG